MNEHSTTLLAAEDTPRPGDSYVQSFARGLAVLRSFGAQAPQQTLSEVAERAQLTRAGARRILLTLLQLGYVEADGRLFRLTPKVLDLGYAYLSSLPIWTQAQPLLEELMQALRQSCSATVLDGDDIVYVVRLSAHRTMSINLGIGSRLPSYCTSMGRVLLSNLAPDALRARLSNMALLKVTPATKVDIEALMEEIAQVRRQGWCLVQEELEQGLVALAAPVFDRSGKIVAAINVSGQAAGPSVAQLMEQSLPKLLETASRVSALIKVQQ
ncbi:IclR family transcriptional regulator domain-containing protein [Janthinobacterium psychrotolerans]|uniref:IclR family transcriptional regulator, pca regulon regulatory protein n=1 Tax=Janthinobacterium psychrotolerans TaxID=1747903 RepID=A0A1A7BYJ6_9BURK|nr:IclR family transcriptional regulator C-terminal domain-containing protein [Janthinobacterium psychrotolerans]OBV37550.1 IclR family transcriptional regulator, pca regulon regulatory protein [Janthinobacterium psychrotolerans]